MNQDQRKFLIEQVEHTCTEQIEKLEEQIPTKPSLNNYIIAAFLDNSIKFADIDKLKKKMREGVLKLGSRQTLIEETDEDDDTYYGRRRRSNGKSIETVKVSAEDIFVIPQDYKDALAEYEKKKEIIEKKIEALKGTKKTIVLKLQKRCSHCGNWT